jgi:hypothetical protein
MLLLAGCTPSPYLPEDTFSIAGVVPEDGSTDVVEAAIPELRFDRPIDATTCTPDTLRIDGILDDGTVAFTMPLAVESLDSGYRVQLETDDPFPGGWTYAISARADDDGACYSLDGIVLEPFASTFAVP